MPRAKYYRARPFKQATTPGGTPRFHKDGRPVRYRAPSKEKPTTQSAQRGTTKACNRAAVDADGQVRLNAAGDPIRYRAPNGSPETTFREQRAQLQRQKRKRQKEKALPMPVWVKNKLVQQQQEQQAEEQQQQAAQQCPPPAEYLAAHEAEICRLIVEVLGSDLDEDHETLGCAH